MDSKQARPVSPGRLVGSLVLALLIGGLLPLLSVFQISLLAPVLMVGGIFAVYLEVRSGWIPVAALVAAALASSLWAMGERLTLVLLAASLLPALVVIRGVNQKAPFFDQLRAGIIAFAAGLLTAVAIAYASFGSGMVAQFTNLLRAQYDQMPDAALAPFVEWTNSMLTGRTGGAGQLMNVAFFRAQLSGVLDLLQQTYAQLLPGALLSGAVLSGAIAVLWGNWTQARRGMATSESFVGMSGWFMSPQLSIGAVALWLVGVIMLYSGAENGETVYMTISQVAGAGFALQALGALERRLLLADRSLKRRRLLLGLFAAFALIFRGMGSMLSYIGVASALFGSHGAIKLWLQKRRDDHSDRDDPDE